MRDRVRFPAHHAAGYPGMEMKSRPRWTLLAPIGSLARPIALRA
jgi:hypothetical protein